MRSDLLTNGKTSKSPEESRPHFGWTPKSNTAAREIYARLTGAGVGNNYADIVRRQTLTADEWPEAMALICDHAFAGKPFPIAELTEMFANGHVNLEGVEVPELEPEGDSEEDISELEGVEVPEGETEVWATLAALTKPERKAIRRLAR